MTDMGRVLILSASVGAGHVRAAAAIAEACAGCGQLTARCVDIMEFIPAGLRSVLLKNYYRTLASFPQLYAAAYDWGNESNTAAWWRGALSRWGGGKLGRLLNEWPPDLIVCTHATPAGIVDYYCRRRGLAVPCLNVVTDFTVHGLWRYESAWGYCVADSELECQINDYLNPPGGVWASGIPVARQFAAGYDKALLRDRLGLDQNRPTVLVMGGGAGLMPMLSVARTIAAEFAAAAIICVTGANAPLYGALTALQRDLPNIVEVYQFIDNIHEYMAAADILISKPGGLTVSEALCLKLPLIAYAPLSGQELANATFVARSGAGMVANDMEELAALAARWRSGRLDITQMARRAAANAKPQAAAQIAAIIRNFICK